MNALALHDAAGVDLVVIANALSFSSKKHRNQRRKDEEASPYINHPIALFRELVNAGVRNTVALAGSLLHDTVEDTETTPEELDAEFGTEVRGVVLEVTDDKRLEKAERKRLQVEHAPHLTYPAKLVKIADKISNLTDIAESAPPQWNLARRQKYFDWAREVVMALNLPATPEAQALLQRFEEAYARRPTSI